MAGLRDRITSKYNIQECRGTSPQFDFGRQRLPRNDIFIPESWTAMDRASLLAFLHRISGDGARKKGNGGILVFRKYLSPLDLYKYLVGRFGRPNGVQTIFKKQQDSDNLFHWDFLVQAGPHHIWFQGGNRDVHVMIFDKKMKPREWVWFANNIKSDFARVSAEIASVGEKIEKWSIISNRFLLIADVCAEHHEILMDNIGEPDFAPPKRNNERGIRRYIKKINDIGQRANRLFNSSLCLDLVTPIFAESYINFVIFMLRKNEFKKTADNMMPLFDSR